MVPWLPAFHDDVNKWKHFPRYWPFVRGIQLSPVNSPHKGRWRGALIFSLICAKINGWVSTHEAGDLRRHRAHYGVIVMQFYICQIDNNPPNIQFWWTAVPIICSQLSPNSQKIFKKKTSRPEIMAIPKCLDCSRQQIYCTSFYSMAACQRAGFLVWKN